MVLGLAALGLVFVFSEWPPVLRYGVLGAAILFFVLAQIAARRNRSTGKKLPLLELYQIAENHGVDLESGGRKRLNTAVRQGAIRGYLPIFGRQLRGAPRSLDDPRALDDGRYPMSDISADHLRAFAIEDEAGLAEGNNVTIKTVPEHDGGTALDGFYDLHVDYAIATEMIRSWRRALLVERGSD